jgi:hypothetical protein
VAKTTEMVLKPGCFGIKNYLHPHHPSCKG